MKLCSIIRPLPQSHSRRNGEIVVFSVTDGRINAKESCANVPEEEIRRGDDACEQGEVEWVP